MSVRVATVHSLLTTKLSLVYDYGMPSPDIVAFPIWVNALLFVPILLWIYWRKHPLSLHPQELFFDALFGIAFGCIEGACVVYLRAASGLLPGFQGTLLDVQYAATHILYNQQILASKLPLSLLTVELIREVGTMIMIVSIAWVSTRFLKEKIALFMWVFAWWDFFYYIFLYATVRWPQTLFTKDILFLIPQPWYADVWFPILVDVLMILAILLSGSMRSMKHSISRK